MKKLIPLLISFLISVNSYTQSCTSTVYFDNMETYTWFGNWWTYSFSTFLNNNSVSPTTSAVHYGSGTGSSGIEQDWYVLPTIVGLNPNYTYVVRFKLASFTVTSPTSTARGLDGTDFLQVQLSTNGNPYVAEMTIAGFNNQTWNYNATGVATKIANGTNTIYQIAVGGVRTDAYSTVELTLQPNTTSVAMDIYTRCNAAGEEFWIDNVELIEMIPSPILTINGVNSVCDGTPTTLTASGAQTYVWNGGITNGVSFTPTSTTSYSVTGTNVGMVNGLGTTNTCASTTSINVQVKPVPNIPTLSPDTIICPADFAVLSGLSNIGTIQWFDSPTNGTLLGTGITYTTQPLTNPTSFYAQSELDGCISNRSIVNVDMDPDCILPIYLSQFNGENVGRTNQLYWITEQEINSSHFEVERSKDGFSFESIGIINANNSNPYEFTDYNILVGENYYRLKMVDKDGYFEYSNIIVLDGNFTINYDVFPNPFSETMTYTYYNENGEDLEIEVFDLLGKSVLYYISECNFCINSTTLNLKDLSSGNYILKIKHLTTGHCSIIKIIKK